MANAPIIVSGLKITSSLDRFVAEWQVLDPNWNGLPVLSLDRVELWAATSNDRNLATKVADGITNAAHFVADGVQRWYWIKPRNRSGGFGDWYPAGTATGYPVLLQSCGKLLIRTSGRPPDLLMGVHLISSGTFKSERLFISIFDTPFS
jgi:hypothetical protein